jgi:NTP pyrophosphatase (non-canonical NTP hydrolase)
MNYVKNESVGKGSSPSQLLSVICGSFRRNPEQLRAEFNQLQSAGCTVLSPLSLDFVGEVDGFVFGRGELGQASSDIEQRHLRSMQKADLVWLHCPQGYVGASAAMELGFARAIGIRIFSECRPDDVTLSGLVTVCDSPAAAATIVRRDLGDAPSDAFPALQSYYARVARQRGWSEETAEQTVGLLRGEVDELHAALDQQSLEAAALELADVQLYVVHMANILGLDLGSAVRDKERINAVRFGAGAERVAA